MTPITILCTALLELHDPWSGIPRAEALETCTKVAHAAIEVGEDPAEAAAQAGIESRWHAAAARGLGHGPLQVLPRYYCPRSGPCDLITAGLEARARWAKAMRAKGLRRPVDALCAYHRGYAYRGGGCAYGRKVLGLAERARAQVEARVAAAGEAM